VDATFELGAPDHYREVGMASQVQDQMVPGQCRLQWAYIGINLTDDRGISGLPVIPPQSKGFPQLSR
jgi:hypothetical protein